MENRGEILALHVLHGDELYSLSFPEIVDTHHIAVGDLGSEDQLLLEAVQDGAIAGQVGTNHLERDHAAQLHIPRFVNGAHAAFAQQAQHFITLSQQLAGSEGVLSRLGVASRQYLGSRNDCGAVAGVGIGGGVWSKAENGISIAWEMNIGRRAFTLHRGAHTTIARFFGVLPGRIRSFFSHDSTAPDSLKLRRISAVYSGRSLDFAAKTRPTALTRCRSGSF